METPSLSSKKKGSWWPKIIIAAYILFAAFIGNMVRQAMQTDVDLVSADYYQKELAYQQHIDRVKATQKLNEQVLINQAVAAEQVSLVFPEELKPASVQGTVHFFRPSAGKLDFEVPLKLNPDRQQHISTTELATGLWRIKINWQVAGQPYYSQKDITIE
jgi:hypothetical protein